MNERFLIIGLGSIGRRHLTNLRKLRPDSKIAVLAIGRVRSNGCMSRGSGRAVYQLAGRAGLRAHGGHYRQPRDGPS